jgi:hypothetical protein
MVYFIKMIRRILATIPANFEALMMSIQTGRHFQFGLHDSPVLLFQPNIKTGLSNAAQPQSSSKNHTFPFSGGLLETARS